MQCDDDERVVQLEKDKAELRRRLEFVEELVGPTEAQRKTLQEQIIAARGAALRAKYRGAGLPTKVAGRLDDRLLLACGLTERDAGLLQGGCLPDKEGILQDVSLLGDPSFQPYDEQTGETRWHARGGMLQLSLGEVRSRFGDDIANDVVRCARELDSWDPSRRVGVELPWHPMEDRELQPAEVIDLMDRELSLQSSLMYLDEHEPVLQPPAHDISHIDQASPYAAVNALRGPRSRGRGRRARGRAVGGVQHSGARAGLGAASGSHNGAGRAGRRSGSAGSAHAQPTASTVVPLPRLGETTTRRAPDARCGLPGHLRHRMQESLDHSLLGCTERIRLF